MAVLLSRVTQGYQAACPPRGCELAALTRELERAGSCRTAFLIRLFARLAESTAIALAFLALEARPPQFLTIPTLPVTATVDVDASRSNLNTLRECRHGGEKSRCGNDGECIHAHWMILLMWSTSKLNFLIGTKP